MNKLIKRVYYLDKIEAALKSVSIVVLVGSRQVGKTSIMEMLNYSPSVRLNGEEVEAALVFETVESAENYIKIHLGERVKGFVFIDEFQYINNVSKVLKILIDKHKGLKFICSGSSSLDIHQKIEESLAGRVRTIEVFSLSFPEYIQFAAPSLLDEYNKYLPDLENQVFNPKLKGFLEDYLVYGGLPRVALADDYEEKQELLNDIYETYLLKDVRSYVRNEDFVGFNKLLKFLSLQIGNLVNINELSKLCMLSYVKCEEYINLLNQMYVAKFVNPFTSNRIKEITKMKKMYFLDIGLRNIIIKNFADIEYRQDNGALFENFVYLELLKFKKVIDEIYFYRTSDGMEIDFIFRHNEKIYPIEVKYSEFKTPKSFRNLTAFMRNHNLRQSLLINKNFTGKSKDPKIQINFIPAILTSKLDRMIISGASKL